MCQFNFPGGLFDFPGGLPNASAAGVSLPIWSLFVFIALFLVMSICFAISLLTKPGSVELGYVSFENSPAVAAFSRFVGGVAGLLGVGVLALGIISAVV